MVRWLDAEGDAVFCEPQRPHLGGDTCLGVMAILLLLDVGLVWLTDRRFKRNRLILD
jgi:hypothetical protein